MARNVSVVCQLSWSDQELVNDVSVFAYCHSLFCVFFFSLIYSYKVPNATLHHIICFQSPFVDALIYSTSHDATECF